MEYFTADVPCNPTELVHFRNRIGESGIELILKESIRIDNDENNEKGKGDDVAFIDSSVQEKNITYPTDSKLRSTNGLVIHIFNKLAAILSKKAFTFAILV